MKQYKVIILLSIPFMILNSSSEARAQGQVGKRLDFHPMQFVTSPIQSTVSSAKYLQEKVKEFIHPIRDLSPTITGLERPLKDLSKPIRDLNKPITDLDKPISDLQSPLTNLSKPIESLESPITNLKQPLEGLQTPLNKVETSVNSIHQPIVDVGGSLNKLSPNLKGLENSTSNLNTPLVDLHKSTSKLSSPIEKLSIGIDSLGEDLQEVSQIKLVNEPILKLEGQVNSLAVSVNRLSDAIFALLMGIGVLVVIAFSYAIWFASRNMKFDQRVLESYRQDEVKKADSEKELVS